MPERKKIVQPDCCANCDYLRWGQEEGADFCQINKTGIDWFVKDREVCDAHKKSVFKDPRIRK